MKAMGRTGTLFTITHAETLAAKTWSIVSLLSPISLICIYDGFINLTRTRHYEIYHNITNAEILAAKIQL